RPTGVLLNISIWGHRSDFDMHKLVMKEIDLRGSIGYVNNHPAVIELVESGKIDLAPFITGRIALDDLIDKGFDTLSHRNETAGKVLVSPSGMGIDPAGCAGRDARGVGQGEVSDPPRPAERARRPREPVGTSRGRGGSQRQPGA